MSFLSIFSAAIFHKPFSFGALEAFVMFSRKSNAIKGLNFPSRRLNITIKHRENERRKMMKISAAFMLFRTAHNMNEPLMYVWLCFNNPFFCRLSLVAGGMKISQRTMREIKQHTLQNGRVDEEIIAQFSFSCENLRASCFTEFSPDSETSDFSLLHTFRLTTIHRILLHFPLPRKNYFSFFTARSHTTRSAAISANNGEPEKPQAGETKKSFSTRAFE